MVYRDTLDSLLRGESFRKPVSLGILLTLIKGKEVLSHYNPLLFISEISFMYICFRLLHLGFHLLWCVSAYLYTFPFYYMFPLITFYSCLLLLLLAYFGASIFISLTFHLALGVVS